jgi:hypothetical protein
VQVEPEAVTPGAVAWNGRTELTVKLSKTSTSIGWSNMSGNGYAAIPAGKQVRFISL